MPCSRKLQEVRRHLRHLQDSGPRFRDPDSHSTGQSTQQGCRVVVTDALHNMHPASVASHICQPRGNYLLDNISTTPRAIGKLCRGTPSRWVPSSKDPWLQAMSRNRFPVPSDRCGWLSSNADVLVWLGHQKLRPSLRVCRNSLDRRRASEFLGLSIEQMWLWSQVVCPQLLQELHICLSASFAFQTMYSTCSPSLQLQSTLYSSSHLPPGFADSARYQPTSTTAAPRASRPTVKRPGLAPWPWPPCSKHV